MQGLPTSVIRNAMLSGRVLFFCCLLVLSTAVLVLGGRVLRYGSLDAVIGFGCLPGQLDCPVKSNAVLMPASAQVYQTGGYDGQFYYFVAATIYNKGQPVLDDTALRMSRIGFPLLTGWAFELGGPSALIVAMLAVPIAVHICVVYLCWFTQRRRGAGLLMLLWVLQPIWLLSLGLGLADGLALDLAMLALLSFYLKRKSRWFTIAWMPLLALAILTKETMLCVWPVFVALILFARDKTWPVRLGQILLAMVPLYALFFWWHQIDYEPGSTIAHGGWPLQGYFNYWQAPDALWSGRGLLALAYALLLCGVPWALVILVKELIHFWPVLPGQVVRQRVVLALCWVMATSLIAMATADEYWSNFANIVRLFAPAGLLVVLLVRPGLRRIRPPYLTSGLSVLSVTLSIWILIDIWTAELLPVLPMRFH